MSKPIPCERVAAFARAFLKMNRVQFLKIDEEQTPPAPNVLRDRKGTRSGAEGQGPSRPVPVPLAQTVKQA